MGAAEATLKMLLLGEDRSASKAVRGLADESGEAADAIGEIEDVSKTAFAAVLTAAAAVGAGLIQALDIEAANDQLAAQLGATPEQAASYGKAAGDLYAANFGTGMDQVNEGIRSVVQNLDGMADASNADLERITGKALTLTNVFGEDLNGVTRAAAQLMRNGLAPSADAALDLITVGLQGNANKSEDLLDTFNEYSTMFRDLGLGGKGALGLINQGLQAGARDADTVADALKEFAIRAQDASETSAAGFEAIGLDAEEMTKRVAKGGPGARKALKQVLDGLREMDDPVKRNAAAVALFGTKAEDLGDSLYALDLDTAAKDLGKVNGAAQEVADTVGDNAKSKVEQFGRELQTAFIDILGNEVIPIIEENKELVMVLTGLLLVGAGAYKTITTAAALYAAVQKIQEVNAKRAAAGQVALNVAMIANPIGLVVVALAALAAGLVIAYKKSETFREIVNTAFRKIADVAIWIWNNVLSKVFEFWGKAIGTVMEIWARLFRAISKVPGFGWVGGLADKLDTAADKARNLDLKIDNVGKNKAKPKVDTSSIDNALTKAERLRGVLNDLNSGKNKGNVDPTLGGLVDPNGRTRGGTPLDGMVDGLHKGRIKVERALQLVRDDIKGDLQELSDLRTQRAEMVSTFSKNNLFGTDLENAAGQTGLDALLAAAIGERDQAAQLKADVAKLSGPGGLSKSLLQQLQAQGSAGAAQIHALAGADPSQIAMLNDLDKQTSAALSAAGLAVGNKIRGGSIDAEIAAKRQEIAIERAFAKALTKFDMEVHVHLEGDTIVKTLRARKKRTGRSLSAEGV